MSGDGTFGPLPVPTPTAERMAAVAEVLGDPNPIHLDPLAVSALGLGDRRINQGPVNLGYVIDALSGVQPSRRLASVRARFVSNVFEGDELSVSGTLRSADGGGTEAAYHLDVVGSGIAVEGVATFEEPTTPSVPEYDESGVIVHDGVPLRWWSWGTSGPTIALVHGGIAHTGWWYRTARLLADRFRVIAFDSSGHGDSGWREHYTVSDWADEVAAVVRHLAPDGAVMIAHSLGARGALVAAARHPRLITGLTIVDAPIPVPDDGEAPFTLSPRLYGSQEEAIERFSLRPNDGVHPDRDLRGLARSSIRRVPGGWSWKVDPRILTRHDQGLPNAVIADVTVPVACVVADSSDITAEFDPDGLQRALGREIEVVRVSRAGHHFMLDDPTRTADIIASLQMLSPDTGERPHDEHH